MSGAAEALAQAPLLRDLPPEALARLGTAARRRTYRRGEVIFHEGDSGDTLYVLQSGRAKVVTDSESGGEALFTIVGPGECFGELSLLDGEPRSATVEALESIEALTLRREDLMDAVHANPGTVDAILLALTTRIRRLTNMVGDLAFLDLEGRLAKKLLELAQEHGRANASSVAIELPLTQEDLAAMIGATRTSVNRALGWYEDQGAIRRDGRQIVVLDAGKLRRRAG